MIRRAFVDTNVWVYSVDGADPVKQARARAVLHPQHAADLVISAQVLGEFYNVVTRKLATPVPGPIATELVTQMSRLPVVPIDAALVNEAIQDAGRWKIAYWDALIVAAARSAGCRTVLSEDLVDGQEYGEVRVFNPFLSDPPLSSLDLLRQERGER